MPTVNLPLPNRKALSTIRALKSPDGVNWSVVSHTLDSVKNEISVDIDTGDLVQLSTKLFSKQTRPSTNKPVYNAKAGLMDVFAGAYYAPKYGGVFEESLLGKVIKGSLAGLYQNLPLTEYVLDVPQSALNANSAYDTKHTPLSIVMPNNNSPAVKVLPYQISNNGQGSIGYQANELTWDAAKSLGSAFSSIDGETAPTFIKGTLLHITEGAFTGRYLTLVTLSGYGRFNDNRWMRLPNGNIAWCSSGSMVEVLKAWDGSGWGDDGTMKITDSGSDTFVDLNGNTQLSVCHELSIPMGWTQNRARVGSQVEGG